MTTARPVPPLEAGDRLTRAEFERRYAAMPHVKKAELVEGVVYMPSPVSLRHGEPHADVVAWLSLYRLSTAGVRVVTDGTVRLDNENEFQPDALLRIAPGCGGQSRTADDYVEGAPELVVEVATSSVSRDLHDKLRAYCRNGVREYLVVRVLDHELDWFVLREGAFVRLEPDSGGIQRSEVFPGLWLDAGALLRGDLLSVSAALAEGCGTPEHADFVQRLARAAGAPPS